MRRTPWVTIGEIDSKSSTNPSLKERMDSTCQRILFAISWLSIGCFSFGGNSSWHYLEENPVGSYFQNAVLHESKIYWIQYRKPLNKIFVFDTDLRKWSTLKAKGVLPDCNALSSPLIVDQHIFLQGLCNREKIASMLRFSLHELLWEFHLSPSGLHPSSVFGAYLFSHEGKIYSYGGLESQDTAESSILWRYISDGQWHRLLTTGSTPNLIDPVKVYGNCSIFVTGGRNMIQERSLILWILPLDVLEWRKQEIITLVDWSSSITLIDNTLWVYMHFQNETSSQSWVTILELGNRQQVIASIVLNSTSTLAYSGGPLGRPTPRKRPSLLSRNGTLFLVGGYLAKAYSDIWRLDQDTLKWSWSSLHESPVNRLSNYFAPLNESSFIFYGGSRTDNILHPINDVWLFNTESTSWTCLMREHFCSASNTTCGPILNYAVYSFYNQTLYVIGGSISSLSAANVFRKLQLDRLEWTSFNLTETKTGAVVDSLPYGACFVSKEEKTFILFGRYQDDLSISYPFSIWEIDLTNQTAKQITPLGQHPPVRLFPTCTLVDRYIYVANGIRPGIYQYSDVWQFNIDTMTWRFIGGHDYTLTEAFGPGIFLPYKSPILLMNVMLASPNDIIALMITGQGFQQVPIPSDSPGFALGHAFMKDQTALVYTITNTIEAPISIVKIELNKLFCAPLQKVIVVDKIVLEDGSGELEYMQGTDCVWTIIGANWIQVNSLDLADGAELVAESSGFQIPYIATPKFRNATNHIRLSKQDVGDFIRMKSNIITLSFKVSKTAATRQGFRVTFLNCGKGFVPSDGRCSCLQGSFISLSGDCIQDRHKDNPGVLPYWKPQLEKSSRITSFSAYLGNAFEFEGSIFLVNGLESPNSFLALPYFDGSRAVRMRTDGGDRFLLQEVSFNGENPGALYGACTAMIGSQLWTFGGVPLAGESPYVFSLEMQTLSWSKHAKLPFSRVSGQTCLSDGDLVYIIGGSRVNPGQFESSRIYNTDQNNWIQFPGFLHGPNVSYASGAVYNDSIFIFGGWDGQSEVDLLWSYSKKIHEWKFISIKPAPTESIQSGWNTGTLSRQQACNWVFKNELHIFGGVRNGVALKDVLVINLEFGDVVYYQEDDGVEPWPPKYPQARYGSASVLVNELGFMLGGAISVRETAHDTWVYLLEMRSWIQNSLSDMPIPRRDHGFWRGSDGEFFVFGGISQQSRIVYLNDLWKYWPDNNTWVMLSGLYQTSSAPRGRSQMAVGEMSGIIYVFGGRMETTAQDLNLWMYSIEAHKWTPHVVSVSLEILPLLLSSSSFVVYQKGWLVLARQNGGATSRASLFSISWSSSSVSVLAAKNGGPSFRSRAGLGIWNSKLVVSGGIGVDGSVLQDVWIFSLDSMTWVASEVTTGQRRILPSFAVQAKFMVIIGEEIGTNTQVRLLDMDSVNIIKNIIPASHDLVELSGQGSIWAGDEIWIYGGQKLNLHPTNIFALKPSTCKPDNSTIQGDVKTQFLDDGSLLVAYFSPYICTFIVERSNTVEVEFDLAINDKLLLRSLAQLDHLFEPILMQGKGSNTVLIPEDGFMIELYSSYNLSNTADGFRLWHTYCPPNSLYQSKVGCTCNSGYVLETSDLLCVQCEATSCDSLRSEGKGSMLLEIILPALIVGLLLIALAVVSKHYIKGIRRSRLKYIRRLMLGDRHDFILGVSFQKETIPHTFRGSIKGQIVEIDMISVSELSLDEIESRIDAISSFRHPNIQLYMGACIVDSKLWVAFEWMGVGTLSFFLKMRKKITTKAKIDILAQIANGMVFLHSFPTPVIHGNLSSGMILVDGQCRVKISGIARVVFQSPTDVAHPLGKLPWCAPEVINNNVKTTMSDSYSYGIIAWEVFSQKLPYVDNEHGLDIIHRIIDDVMRPEIPAGCPYDMQNLIQKCWSNRPTSRPPFLEIMQMLKEIRRSNTLDTAVQDAETDEKPVFQETYMLSTRLWMEELLWAKFPQKAHALSTILYDEVKKVCSNASMDLVVESDLVFWATTPSLEICLKTASSLLSEIERLECDSELQELYCRVCPGSELINAIRIQIVVSGLRKEEGQTVRQGMLSTTIYKTCTEGFRYCQGGQILLSASLLDDFSSLPLPDHLTRKIITPPSGDDFLEILPASLKERSSFFEVLEYTKNRRQQATRLNSIDYEEGETGKTSYDFLLDWNNLSRGRSEPSSCSLSSVWKAELTNGRFGFARDIYPQSLTTADRIVLKREIYSAKNWRHPNIATLAGYCFSKSVVITAISENSFESLDCHIKAIKNPTVLNRFRYDAALQTVAGLSYLHSLYPPQSFRGLDWRNIRVVSDDRIQLGFPVFSCEFRNGSLQFIPRIACRAPEAISRSKASVAGDLYSFGVFLWEISALTEAFVGLNEIELSRLFGGGSIFDLSDIQTPDLRQTIESLTQQNPDLRPNISSIEATPDWWG